MNFPLTFPLLLMLSLAALLPAGLLHAADSGAVPDPLPLSRYQAMIEKSPFAPATAAPATAAETPSFAADYYITGIARLGGRPFVTFSSRDHQKQFALLEGQSANGMTLASVKWAPEVGKSTATLQKGSEFGTVSFDEAAMQPAPVVVTPPPSNHAQADSRNQRGRSSGNFGYGDRRRSTTGFDRNSPEWQERRRAWIERMRAEGWDPNRRSSDNENGSQWRRRPTAIPAAPRQ